MHTLPMIDFASNFLKNGSLEDCYIIGVQHLLPTTLQMFQALFKKGLKPENLALIGKCYSTDLPTYDAMQKEGIDVCPSSKAFDSHEVYDEAFESNIVKFIEARKDKINSSCFKRVIILDDGGDFINLVSPHVTRKEGISAMEQTSAGYQRLVGKNYPFPIVNMARAFAKLQCEPKKIVELGLQKTEYYLATCGRDVRKVLIIGKGAIGGQIYRALKDRYEVSCYDVVSGISDFSTEELHRKLGEFDLIIGCSGKTSIPAEHHPFLKKGCILVSLSSSDREFDAVHLRRRGSKTHCCFDHVDANGVILLNCGFPIGFDGKEDVDDPEFFQFVRALIIACIAQGEHKNLKNGLIPLNHEYQIKILRAFYMLGAVAQKMQHSKENRVLIPICH